MALLSALSWEEELRTEHDEDWYRNPRAQMQLREEYVVAPRLSVSEDSCLRGLALVGDKLSDA